MVKYNGEGWAIKIRHFSDHGSPGSHTNPHDREIKYDPHNGAPDFKATQDINYPAEEYPEGTPEFKHYPGVIYHQYDPEAWRFRTLSEFKSSVTRGAEINFEWKGREYHICPVWPNGEVKYSIRPLDTQIQSVFDSAEEMLSYLVGEDRLRDIIKDALITDRTL